MRYLGLEPFGGVTDRLTLRELQEPEDCLEALGWLGACAGGRNGPGMLHWDDCNTIRQSLVICLFKKKLYKKFANLMNFSLILKIV